MLTVLVEIAGFNTEGIIRLVFGKVFTTYFGGFLNKARPLVWFTPTSWNDAKCQYVKYIKL